jgi:transposase-like protein
MNICISEQCRKYAFSPTVFYKWRKKFIRGGKLPLSGTLKDRCRERETENERLKKLIGELIIANDAMKKVLAWEREK